MSLIWDNSPDVVQYCLEHYNLGKKIESWISMHQFNTIYFDGVTVAHLLNKRFTPAQEKLLETKLFLSEMLPWQTIEAHQYIDQALCKDEQKRRKNKK